MKPSNNRSLIVALVAVSFSACKEASEEHAHGHHGEQRKIVVTSPDVRDVVSTQQYVCQIHSCRHIDVCALESGYLEEITIREGQWVNQGDPLFRIVPTLYQARLESEAAEAQLAQIELENSQKLFEDNMVSDRDVALAKAKLAKAVAQMNLAQAELNFTVIKAPFSGIVDRLHHQQGSLIEEGEDLTTLSDNSLMWVYFNVPEARYLEYKAGLEKEQDKLGIDLVLANGERFSESGKIGAIEAEFNNETGNIAFRADFPNPDHLLRHGQTGTILVSHPLKDAIVIPQRSTYEILAKKYVYVIEPVEERTASADEDNSLHKTSSEHGHEHEHEHEPNDGKSRRLMRGVVRQREIVIESEQDDIFLIEHGLKPDEKIIFEGVRQVRDGEEVEYEYRAPDEVLKNLKFKAE